MTSCFKKDQSKIRICHSLYRYVISNNKYMKDYNQFKELSYLEYWDVNNFHG